MSDTKSGTHLVEVLYNIDVNRDWPEPPKGVTLILSSEPGLSINVLFTPRKPELLVALTEGARIATEYVWNALGRPRRLAVSPVRAAIHSVPEWQALLANEKAYTRPTGLHAPKPKRDPKDDGLAGV